MEYISFLAGEKWTDFPSCTNRTLAKIAQYANDSLRDERRQELLPLLPRLMGTPDTSLEVNMAIAEEAASMVLPLVGHTMTLVHNLAEDAQLGIHAAHPHPESISTSAFVAADVAGWDVVAFLSSLIDAYDKAAGRVDSPVVTEDDFRRLAELANA
jgi:hypothetical protein